MIPVRNAQTIRLYALILVVLNLIIYLQTAGFEFVHYDDNAYVFSNPHVAGGLTIENIRWALTSTENSLWLPLTRLSYLTDATIAGIKPGWFHLVNVALHCINTVLLLYLLVELTGEIGRSTVAAALFSCHPLRVESVVWVTERKDMLSMCLLLISLLMYVRSARSQSRKTFAGSAVFYAGSLMAKPMAVSLPVLLPILDWWPLGRFGKKSSPARQNANIRRSGKDINRHHSFVRILLEKTPYAFFTVVVTLITIFANQGALKAGDIVPLHVRLANTAVSTVRYLGNMVWPSGLTFYYPFDRSLLAPVTVVSAVIVLFAISTGAYMLRRHSPCLLAGWGWYLIALLPVSGIVQAGSQAMADRFTYLPMIGIVVMISWGGAALFKRLRVPENTVKGLVLLTVLAISVTSFIQARTWHDSETLFTHARAVTKDNYIATLNLANLYLSRGKADAAEPLYRETLRIRPDSGAAHVNLASILIGRGEYEEAYGHLNQALLDMPDNPMVHRALAETLTRLGRQEEADRHLREYQRLMRLQGQ